MSNPHRVNSGEYPGRKPNPMRTSKPPLNEGGQIIQVTMLRIKSSGQLLYLEAGKDLVDVLFSFLVLPVGTIIGLLNAEGAKDYRNFGAMDNIYKSVEKLQGSMLYVDKDVLTRPRPASSVLPGLHFLEPSQTYTPLPSPTTHHVCASCRQFIGTDPDFSCPKCDSRNPPGCSVTSKSIVTVVPSKESQLALVSKPKEGYVKKSATYIVSNNLEIMPSSSIKSIDVLNKMKIQNLSDLESTDEEIDRMDVLEILLKAISGSETPLSDVFDRKVKGCTS